MDYSKENLDEIFNYGEKILSELEKAAVEKDNELEKANRRFENLRDDLKELLNKN